VVQVAKCLPSKLEATSSNPCTTKKKKKKKKGVNKFQYGPGLKIKETYDNDSWSQVLRALVAQACNSSYSGGRDQEDKRLKPAQANS
jgi:hypothetical protein